MKKLNHLSVALKDSGLASESYLIQKLAREYVESVAKEGLSGEFYGAIKSIEKDLFMWRRDTTASLEKYFSEKYPDIKNKDLMVSIESCFYDWTLGYSKSIGSGDTNIPPWLFGFLDGKIFPMIKDSFSKAIDDLPADSETKVGLQEWLSSTTLEQLGIQSISGLLDSNLELWTLSITNLVHEIHHNILNHSVYKRFYQLGNDFDKYNLLDAMEEGFALTLGSAHRGEDISSIYATFAKDMADFMIPILKRIIGPSKKNDSEILFFKNWKNIDSHLAQIMGNDMGVKLSAEKIIFLKKVFDTFKNNNDLDDFYDWRSESYTLDIPNVEDALASAILQVWSEPGSGGEGYKWDFMTGDDEKLLINLMKNLDQGSGELLRLWQDSEKENFNEALAAVRPCVERSLLK
jgi:hypothetical protein